MSVNAFQNSPCVDVYHCSVGPFTGNLVAANALDKTRSTAPRDKLTDASWSRQRCRVSVVVPKRLYTADIPRTEREEICGLRSDRIRSLRQPYVAPKSLRHPAFKEMFLTQELRQRVLTYLDYESKEKLVRASPLWRQSLQDDVAFFRRVEKILGKPTGFLDGRQFSQPMCDLAPIAASILTKKIYGRVLTQYEQKFADDDVWTDVNDLLLKRDQLRTRGLKYGLACILAFVAGFWIGSKMLILTRILLQGGWLETEGWAWDPNRGGYVRNKPPEFYLPKRESNPFARRQRSFGAELEPLNPIDVFILIRLLSCMIVIAILGSGISAAKKAYDAFSESSKIQSELCSRLT